VGGKGYEDLDIYRDSYNSAMKIHDLSLKLPTFELYEVGSQIRRSSKSIVANIAEGYGRRRYKNEFIRFLIYAYASCNETKVFLRFIHDSGYIKQDRFSKYLEEYNDLGRKIYNFIEIIEKRNP